MDVGSYSSIVRELVAKARGPEFNSLVNAWDFFPLLTCMLTNAVVVKDLWCSSTCSLAVNMVNY